MEDNTKVIDLSQLEEIILQAIKNYCDSIKQTWLDPEGPHNG